jgi:steroid delta-isomerase-like uncharacterized protein
MKRIYIFAALIAIIFVGTLTGLAQKQTKGETRMSDKKEPIDIVKAIFEAFNRHDAEVMASFYAEDVFVDSPDFSAPKRTPKEVAVNYRNYFASTPDIKDDVTNIIVSGNKVIVEFVSSGTIQNPAPDDPPTMKGKKFSLKICSILEIKNGKVVRDITYYDQLSFLKQVGLA